MANKNYQTSHTLFSTFREEGSHGVGAPYTGHTPGKTPDVYFDSKVCSLANGDQYLDPIYREKEINAAAGGKPVSDKAFFPPNCTRKSACPGDTSVCIGKMGLLGEDWQNRKAVDDKSSVKGKRNFYTNPPRKGGMGTSLMDRTIGRNAPEYKPDAYQYALVLGKELRQKARERIPKPFNSSPNRGSGLFSTTFLGSVPESPCPQGEKSMPSKPFIPSHPARSGNAYCALSKIGRNYVPVTVDTNQKAKDHSQMPKPAPFKPCGGVKNRLSMWSVNPYQCDARPAPDMGCMLLK